MSCLHPIFNVVKLTLAPEDPIHRRCPLHPPLPEIIDREEEWVVEEILDSKVVNWKLHYLVKWEGFRIEHNSWEPWDHLHALEWVTDFHRKHPGAPRQIQFVEFNAIPFRTLPSVVLGHHSLEGGVDVRGHPSEPISTTELYIPPHHRWPHCYPITYSVTYSITLWHIPLLCDTFHHCSILPLFSLPLLFYVYS